jgi:hypothetical protein
MSGLEGFDKIDYIKRAEERVVDAHAKASGHDVGQRVLLLLAERIRQNKESLGSAAGLIIPTTSLKDRVKPGSVDGPREESLNFDQLAEALETAAQISGAAGLAQRVREETARESIDILSGDDTAAQTDVS